MHYNMGSIDGLRMSKNGGDEMPKKILLVDDEPLIVKGLKYSLEQDGYETDSASDGEEALSKFASDNYDHGKRR